MDVRHNNNALQESNDFIGGLLHLGLNVITFRTLLHLGPNVITVRTLLHLGQLLHLGLLHRCPKGLRDIFLAWRELFANLCQLKSRI